MFIPEHSVIYITGMREALSFHFGNLEESADGLLIDIFRKQITATSCLRWASNVYLFID